MTEHWQSETFRQLMISKIHDFLPPNAQDQTENAAVMEYHIFRKSSTKNEYLDLVAELLIHYHDLQQQQQPQQQQQQGSGPPPPNPETGGGPNMQDPLNDFKNLSIN